MDKKLIIWDIEHLLPRGTCEHEVCWNCFVQSYHVCGFVHSETKWVLCNIHRLEIVKKRKSYIWCFKGILPCAQDGVSCLAWLGASYVASGCVDGKVRLWDSRSGECVKTLKGHSDAIQSLSVSANHDYLVSASVDGTACAFEVENFRWTIPVVLLHRMRLSFIQANPSVFMSLEEGMLPTEIILHELFLDPDNHIEQKAGYFFRRLFFIFNIIGFEL